MIFRSLFINLYYARLAQRIDRRLCRMEMGRWMFGDYRYLLVGLLVVTWLLNVTGYKGKRKSLETWNLELGTWNMEPASL
jgi:hypothetical protein